MPPRKTPQTVTDSVAALITSKPQPLSPDDQVRASLALDLARRIDAPDTEARFIAGLARELRATTDDMAGGADVDAFAEFVARLSAPVVDATD
jgi:hypothetical protein